MKFICKCGAKKGSHRHDGWCEIWAQEADEEVLEPFDDSERLLDERDRARDMGAAR